MKAETLFRMPLLVVVALWLLHRRAVRRLAIIRDITADVVSFKEELAIFEHVEALLVEHGMGWLDRMLLWVISGRRRDVTRAAQFGWMVIGRIPKGKGNDQDR